MSSTLQSTPRIADKAVGGAKRPPRFHIGVWLGVLPFFIFSALILIGPTLILAFRSLEKLGGGLTLSNYRELVSPTVIDAYSMSIKVSLTSAILGGIVGFLIAWAISLGSLPGPFRDATITFAGVASNFAGVPLAAAFIFTLGRVGVLTAMFKTFGVNLY